MSTQEINLTAIADAIREKEGTTEPIPALNFATRIRAISSGGGITDFAIPLVVTVDAGAQVTAVNGDNTIAATAGVDGVANLTLTEPGVWTVTASLGDKEKSVDIKVIKGYETKISLSQRLPDGYTEVEYIHFDGDRTCFELRESVVCNTDRIVCKFYSENNGTSSTNRYLFLFTSTINKTYYYLGASSNAIDSLRVFINSSNAIFVPISTLNELLEFDIDFNNEMYTVNGISISGTSNEHLLGTDSKRIGSTATGSTLASLIGKLYQFTHYRNNVVIHDYVPCTNSSGIAGIFDINTGTFIKNTNTYATNITAGPAV